MQAEEDEQGANLLQGAERLPADDRDLHRAYCADDEEEAVGPVHARVEAAERDEHADVQADHVEHKDVAAPRRDHVGVRDAHQHADRPVAGRPDGQAPQPEGRADRRDGDGLVVELAAHGPHEVRRNDRHDPGRHDRRVDAPRDLVREEAREEGGDRAEPRRDHAADVVHAHRGVVEHLRDLGHEHPAHLPERGEGGVQGEQRRGERQVELAHLLHALPHGHGRHLHAGVDGGADGAAQRVPRLVVIPLEELPQPGEESVLLHLLGQVLRGAVVEPRVELVDDVPEVLDGVQADVVGGVEEVEHEDDLGGDQARGERQATDIHPVRLS
mmetsp:Transcript_78873/g.207057  ORF Transcript_78873/g.207057 Transcript_78873/m.207057 type:complete len:328 (+) Transcript_78873:1767-2750(+)